MAQSTSNGPSLFTSRTTPSFIPYPVAANTNIWGLRPVGINTTTGLAVPVTAIANLRFVGFSQAQANNNPGAAGAINVNVTPAQGPEASYYNMACTGATQAWVGNVLYFVDDQTVSTSAPNSVICGVCTAFLSSTLVTVNIAQRA